MKEQKKVPRSSLSRAGKVSKTAVKVAGKHVVHVATSTFTKSDKKAAKQKKHHQTLAKDVIKTLSQLKGTALKAAQLMCLEYGVLPEEFQDELQKACYFAPPLNKAVIRKVIKNQLGAAPEHCFESFNSTAFAAASIGQVHQACLSGDKKVAVKIQYPGIAETIHNDLSMLRLMLLKLPLPQLKHKKQVVSVYLSELDQRLKEETDYKKEKDAMDFFNRYNCFDNIVIPKSHSEQCTDKIITMDFLEGIHLDKWLKTGPTQKEKNTFAQSIWDFFAYFIMNHSIFHADPNIGNYLLLENGKIGIIDFGCVKKLTIFTPEKLKKIMSLYAKNESQKTIQFYIELGMLPDTKSSYDSAVKEAIEAYSKWINRAFEKSCFDFGKNKDYMSNRTAVMSTLGDRLTGGTSDDVMFFRVFFGLFNIFHKLEATVKLSWDIDVVHNQ